MTPTVAGCRRGFTLLELIIVLLIIGIMLGAIGFSLGGGRERQLETEGERLLALLRLARQETLLTSTATAVGFHAEGYRFYQLQGEQWLTVRDGVFRPRTLELDFRLALRFPEEDDTPATLPYLDHEDDQRLLPRIYFYPGGEMTPFELTLTPENGGPTLRLAGDLMGTLALEHLFR